MDTIFVQTSPSQIDAPFYKGLSQALFNDNVLVITWNNYGQSRKFVDPELGMVPVFPTADGYKNEWIDKRQYGIKALWKRIVRERPKVVILQDQSWREKIWLSSLLRLSGLKVGFRSDKTLLSGTAKKNCFKRKLESRILNLFFDYLIPVSKDTVAYYSWPQHKILVSLPYCSDAAKFVVDNLTHQKERSIIRIKYAIPVDAKVMLAVLKFSERENPRFVLETFKIFQKTNSNAWLIMVGAGPLFEQEQIWVKVNNLQNVIFPGYIPYSELQNFFFAADIYIHLPLVGPWEVSVPDALLAGLAVIATKMVGSANLLMRNNLLQNYLVSPGDVEKAAKCMHELCGSPNPAKLFDCARKVVLDDIEVAAVVNKWKEKISAFG